MTLPLLNIAFRRLSHGKDLSLPTYATSGSAGLDMAAAIETPVLLRPLERALIPSGFCVALPLGYEMQIRPRSGLALKHGITILNAPGTVDADYRGEIKALVINLGQEAFVIEPGMRVAQLVIAPVSKVMPEEVELFEENMAFERNSGGFGSTGLKDFLKSA